MASVEPQFLGTVNTLRMGLVSVPTVSPPRPLPVEGLAVVMTTGVCPDGPTFVFLVEVLRTTQGFQGPGLRGQIWRWGPSRLQATPAVSSHRLCHLTLPSGHSPCISL